MKITIQKINQLFERLSQTQIFLFFLGYALFVRFPFFFRDYIDRDESTFILMGQSWVDGYLPYTELWDLKPPFTFLFFAGIIYVFGKSFIAIRLAGTLLVAFTGLFTFKIGQHIASRKIGLWSGFIVVILQSLFGSLQGVMSEHICVLFFTAGLYLYITKKSLSWQFISGILFGLALFSKLNIAYPILFLMLFMIWEGYRTNTLKFSLTKGTVLLSGIVFIAFVFVLPYIIQDKFQVWIDSVVLAPMAYSSSKLSSLIKVILFFTALVAWLFWSYKYRKLDFNKRGVKILALCSIAIVFSFVQTGKFNGHYLILLYPPFLVLLGLFFSNLSWFKHLNRPVVLGIVFLLIPMESYLEYANIITNKLEKGQFYNGEGIEVPNYLTTNNLETKNILFFEYHIGYWFLDEKPPTKAATHPSNILREAIFPYMDNPRKTGMQELRFLMDSIQPTLIVTRRNRRVFDKSQEEANEYISSYLKTHYAKLDSVAGALIHKRLPRQ